MSMSWVKQISVFNVRVFISSIKTHKAQNRCSTVVWSLPRSTTQWSHTRDYTDFSKSAENPWNSAGTDFTWAWSLTPYVMQGKQQVESCQTVHKLGQTWSSLKADIWPHKLRGFIHWDITICKSAEIHKDELDKREIKGTASLYYTVLQGITLWKTGHCTMMNFHSASYLRMVGLERVRVTSFLSCALSGSLDTSLQMFLAVNVSHSMVDKEA